MKKLILTLTATLVCAGAFSQGKLSFFNNSDNLIYFTTDLTKLVAADRTATADNGGGAGPFPIAGSGLYTGLGLNHTPGTIMSLAGSPTFIAALYGGTSSGSLSLQKTSTIGDVNSEGSVVPVNCAFASLPAGTPAWFQVQVFDSRADASAAVINGAGGGAADAWAHTNLYAGVSQIFQATPTAAVFAWIFQSQPPVNSTWAPETFPVVDMVQYGPGYYGGIEVYANAGPPPTSDLAIALYSGITIEGAAGQTYGIQCSTNLDNTNGWRGLTNLTLQAPAELWLDVQPAAQRQRYYLVVPGPIPIP